LNIITILKKYYSYNKNSCIYGKVKSTISQNIELAKRKKITQLYSSNYLQHIAEHHSIPVMDYEVSSLLKKIPKNSIICDIGGCWGWHWRNISLQRPDVKIVIIDLVYENLLIAKKIIKKNINKQIFLVNDDCSELRINKEIFNIVWTVQTLQHIPKYHKTIKRIFKIIKKGGHLYNYNLNINYLIKIIYKFFNKKYLIKDYNNDFYLERSNINQKKIIEKIFKNYAISRYTELLFHPDLKIKTGSINNIIGKIDALLSGSLLFKKIFAIQEAFIINKKF
jgi:ubiquinone/menaquinone biosynthesis C-methylase UbiE